MSLVQQVRSRICLNRTGKNMFFFWYSKKTEKVKPKKKAPDEASVGKFIISFLLLMAVLAFIKYFKIIVVLALIIGAIIIIWWRMETRKEETTVIDGKSEGNDTSGVISNYTEPEIDRLSYLLEHEIKSVVNTKDPVEMFDSFEDIESIMKQVDELTLNEEEQRIYDLMHLRYDELLKNKTQIVSGMIKWNLDEIAERYPGNKERMNYEFVKKLEPYAGKIKDAGVEIA